METRRQPAIEEVSTEFARASVVSALASVIATNQPALVKRCGGEPLNNAARQYYTSRAERLQNRHHFPQTETVAEAIGRVVDAMDEHGIKGHVELPSTLNNIWPYLPEPERTLSTPARYVN